MGRIILDLCGGTGSWSKPYADAGFEVVVVTLPDYDVNDVDMGNLWLTFISNTAENIRVKYEDIYGILAAPPCTMFSLARTRAKTPRNFHDGMRCVESCMRVIWEVRKRHKLAFWALENPKAYLRQFLGKAAFCFDPWEFGDPWTKKTEIWGYFNEPRKKFTEVEQVMTNEQRALYSTNSRKLPSVSDFTGSKQQSARAKTPEGFAKAFYKANSKSL
jgi:hypothetical protein